MASELLKDRLSVRGPNDIVAVRHDKVGDYV
jgi:hypothetical protein